jgi:uncharacterized protein YciI
VLSMFLVLLKYIKSLEEVERHLDEHVQFLNKYYNQNKFIFSGRRNPRTGGVILINSSTEAEVKQIINEDPFYMHNIAQYEAIEFVPSKYDPRFSCFVD